MCGNAVVDPGEDCDLGVDDALGEQLRCDACRYVCDATAACPAGWGCGSDGTCRHATGAYVESVPSALELPAEDWSIGDVDGDGRADVIALARNGVRVAYGGGDGHLHADYAFLSGREPTGDVTAADVDGDGRTDAIIPHAVGLVVLRGQADQAMGPVAYAPYEISASASDGAWLFAGRVPGFAPEDQLLIVSAGAAYLESHIHLIPDGGDQLVVELDLPHHPLGDLPARMPVADIDAPSESDEFALAFHGEDSVRVMRPSRNPFTGALFNLEVAAVSVSPGLIDRGAQLADVDGDGAVDLVVSVADAPIHVAWNDGTGAFSAATPQPWLDELAGWPLAAGDLDGDGRADYVTADGVYLTGPGDDVTLAAPRVTTSPWTDAVIALLDERSGPGAHPDVAAIVDGEVGIHLLYGAGGGAFNRTWLDTPGPPALLRAGDLDGDGIGDVAFAARGGIDGDQLAVVFGEASGGAVASTTIGQVDGIERLELGRFRDDLGVVDAASDVFLSSPPDAIGSRSVGVFAGAPGRVLLSSFNLRDEARRDDPVLMVRSGRFLPRPGDEPASDLLCLGDGPSGPRMWMVRGVAGAHFERALTSHHDMPAGFDPDGARWGAGDLDGDGVDELVGVDAAGTRLVVDAAVDANGIVTLTSALAPGGPAGRVELIDLDGDGRDELLIGDLTAVNADADPALEVASIDDGGVAIDGALVLPGVTGARVLVADVDGDGLDDLLVANADRIRVFLAIPHVEVAP